MKITETVFPEVFEKYRNTVYSVVFNYVRNVEDTADLQQEVFLKLLCSGNDYESEEHLKAWLIRVSVNLCKNFPTKYHFGDFVDSKVYAKICN